MLFNSPFVLLLAAGFSHVEAIRFLGRVNPATREFSWSGTGLAFTFTGSSAEIELESFRGTNSLSLIIDGEETVISSVSGTAISTPANLTYGNHTVSLRKRSEALFGSIVLGNVTTDGSFGPDVVPKRRIQVIGDSITAGYGIDGLLPCVNTAELEDTTKTYASLAAEALGADIDTIAWSGIGLIRNYVSPGDTSPNMQNRWTRYGAEDPVNSYTFPVADTPDAVVINLGTNDFGYQQGIRGPLNITDYTSQMVSFVQTIQSHYPNAAFFLLTSPMLNDYYPSAEDKQKTVQTEALKDVIERLGNATTARLVEWASQGSEALGCDYHPNRKTNEEAAEVLAGAIREVLGW